MAKIRGERQSELLRLGNAGLGLHDGGDSNRAAMAMGRILRAGGMLAGIIIANVAAHQHFAGV